MTENKLIDFEIHACCSCGVLFAMTEKHINELRRNHKSFYCPNGHSLSFPGTSNKEKIQELTAKIYACHNVRQQKEQEIDKLEKSVKAYKMLYAREKKKVSKQ